MKEHSRTTLWGSQAARLPTAISPANAQSRAGSWPLFWVGLLLMGANLPVVERYGGWMGALVYGLGWTAMLALLLRSWPSVNIWRGAVLAVALLSLVAQVLLLIYVAPAYDGRMDRDDALAMWWQSLFRGDYPYAQPTSMGNPISVLPFLHVVALPFVLLGNVGYPVIASVIVLAFLLWRRYANAPLEQALALLGLATAPVVLFEVAGRSDVIVNMLLFVLLGLWIEASVRNGRRAWLPWLGMFIGAVAATRFALWPALVVPVIYLLSHLSWRQAIIVLVAALAGFFVLVGPFVLWQPAVFFGYAPFGVNSTKLGVNPAWQILWMAFTVAVMLAACIYARKTGRLFPAAATVLATITIATWTTFGYDVSYAQLMVVPLLFSLPERRRQ